MKFSLEKVEQVRESKWNDSISSTKVNTRKGKNRSVFLFFALSTYNLKVWFRYRCICRISRVYRTKKIHRTDRIHSLSYNKLYLSFLLYWAYIREVSIKLYLSYEFFSYDRHDRYNDMETRLKICWKIVWKRLVRLWSGISSLTLWSLLDQKVNITGWSHLD